MEDLTALIVYWKAVLANFDDETTGITRSVIEETIEAIQALKYLQEHLK